jgi:regulator of replication initiation timing
MKKAGGILMLGVLSILIFSGVLLAEERDRDGAVEGTFVRLVEREVSGRGYMGIVIKPHERDDHVTVLVPRQREELWQAARGLQAGQRVGVSFVSEAGHRWIKGMEAERREVVEDDPDYRRRINVRREVFRYEDNPERMRAPRPEYLEQMQELKRILSSNLDRMAREFRDLRERLEEQERELQRLRAENERLRKELQERAGSEREREREVRVRIQREGREQEDRERRRERDEGRAKGERPMSEREVALHQLEVMWMALHALKEANRSDAAELLTLAIRSREMMLEGRRDEEAQRVRERAPNRGQLVEVLSMASKLWREFDNADKSVAVGQLAEQLSGARERQVQERGEREVGRRSKERREADLPEGMIGFRGVLVGRVLRKLDRGFVLKVEKVANVWENNRADRPEAAVGRELIITIRTHEELGGRFLDTLRTLKTGERVLVEAFHFEGNRLTVVEQLQKVE